MMVTIPVAAQDIRFDQITVSDGLSQSSINTILQDRFGFMWFGTSDGLNRYDGYNFQVFKSVKTDPTTLSDSWVTELMEDSRGNLWVGTYGAGLNRMNPDRQSFTRYDIKIDQNLLGLGQNLITSIIEDEHGNIWVASNTLGITIFNGDKVTKLNHQPDNPLSLNGQDVRDLFIDRSKRIWVATERGIDKFDPSTGNFIHYRHNPEDNYSLSSDNCSVVRDDRDGFLWIGTKDGGLNRMDPETGRVERFSNKLDQPNSISSNNVQCIYEDTTGNLWVGTTGGLNRMKKDGTFVRFIHDALKPASVGHASLLSLYEDRGGVLWVGTYGSGLSKFNKNLQGFRYYSHRTTGLNSNDIFGFHEARNGDIWIGTYDGGVNVFNPEDETFSAFRHDPQDPRSLSYDHVSAIHTDRSGKLWVGTHFGLNLFEPETGTFRKWFHDPQDPTSLASNKIIHMLEDRQGNLWLATYDSGLDLMDREQNSFRHFTYETANERSLPNNFTNYLFEDMENRLWVATELGLALMDRQTGEFTRYRHDPKDPQSLSHDSVMCLYQQRHDELWVATYGGGLSLMKISEGTFRHFQQKDGLPNDSVYGILEDGTHNLWLSTNAGICKFNPETNIYTNFDTSNVLYYQEFNRGGFLERSTGELYFGGQGFYRFMPDQINGNEYIPPVVITSFKKNGEEVVSPQAISEMTSLELNYDDTVISFGYAAMDFTSPRKNRFRYQMEGLSEDWINMGHDNNLTYSALSPGTYTLRIQGSNSDGVWNSEPAELTILVNPPMWATRGAYVGYFLILLVISIILFRWRAQLKRRELQRAATMGKAQFASTVLHNIGNVLNSLHVSCEQGRSKLKESKIHQLLRAHNLMRDHLDDIPTFLMQHPKGRLLPGYFISAGEILEEEHQLLTNELEEMNRKITLMRDIIDTQQAHAKQELIIETQDLKGIIEEALKVMQDTLERRNIKIETHFEELPLVKARKSQLMHVIINLVKNAMDAMDSINEKNRHLHIETGRVNISQGFVKIRDNGEGIAPEILPNLFDYGFTTKKTGHGFGLNSCAKTIREMGGTIKAESPGPDKGATFTLILNFGNPGE